MKQKKESLKSRPNSKRRILRSPAVLRKQSQLPYQGSSKESGAAVLDNKSEKSKFIEDLTEKAFKIHEENNLK